MFKEAKASAKVQLSPGNGDAQQSACIIVCAPVFEEGKDLAFALEHEEW